MVAINFPTVLNSNNIFSDILLPSRERKTSIADDKTYVFFHRYIGLTTEDEYFGKISKLHGELTKLDNLYVLFRDKIDILMNDKVTNNVNSHASQITLEKFITGDLVDIFHEQSFFVDSVLQAKFFFGLRAVIRLYSNNEKLNNISIGTNFLVKILTWSLEYIPKLFDFNISIYNPKVIYYGDIKKHEAYFLSLISFMGCDVLYLNSFSDEIFRAIDKGDQISTMEEAQNRIKVKPMPIVESKSPINKGKTLLLACDSIFTEIWVPISKRKDFIAGKLLPIYFQRYIGVKGKDNNGLDSYYNDVFNLDKKLSACSNGYVSFKGSIPMAGNEETFGIMNEILKDTNLFDLNKKDQTITKITNLKSFPKSKDEELNKEIKAIFKEVIYLYFKQETAINASKLQNFTVKLIAWINRYVDRLFKEVIHFDNPKILYYGEIKLHEIYFLIYFSRLGCDIVYINSDINFEKLFLAIDSEEEFMKTTKNQDTSPLQVFPIVEKQVRRATVAYNASQEIQQLIYGDTDTGLFKARQYDEGYTRPIGLRTTYDELKLLWREPANVRPTFKVENNSVYVPNLFAKINGVQENLQEYWQDYKFLIETKNTYIIKSLPFTKATYSKQDLYATAFLFNEKGLVEEEKLFKSHFYKYSYLKTSLQSFIVYKINELILLKPFKEVYDDKFKLKILMTIINLEGDLLKLLEKFDFTAELPKLVVYNNSMTNFSEEDIIIIAFMNLVGSDIVVFTPTNYNNLETLLRPGQFDLHQLPSIGFDLEIPNLAELKEKTSFFKFLDFKGGKK